MNSAITSITFDDISPYRLPISKLNHLLEKLSNLHVPCTMFVIPNDQRRENIHEGEFISCLKRARAFGHELAQHGNMHRGNWFKSEFGSILPIFSPSFAKQREAIEMGRKRFEELTGTRSLGFRAPFYLHNNHTLNILSSLGFCYDSSKTIFKPTHLEFIRLRTLRSLKLSQNRLLEIPITGDYTLHRTSDDLHFCLHHALRDFELMERVGYPFIINNHPNHVNIDFLCSFLEELVAKIRDKTKFVRLCDIKGQS